MLNIKESRARELLRYSVENNILEKLGKTKLARTEEFSVQEFIDFIKLLKR